MSGQGSRVAPHCLILTASVSRATETAPASLGDRNRTYWNERIHDQEMTTAQRGSLRFFDDLDEYRFDKLRYLPSLVNFSGYRERRVLEIGCGIGTDLVRFARGGARITGVDIAERSIGLARRNASLHGVRANGFCVADGAALPFEEGSFDVVYAHGVIQYAAQPDRLIAEARRVLTSGGEAVFMAYNRFSWLPALSTLMRVGLEHADAPALYTFSIAEYRRMLSRFTSVRIVPDRFPVHSRLHGGWKGLLYNRLFVRAFNALPRVLVRRFGWHLMAFCRK